MKKILIILFVLIGYSTIAQKVNRFLITKHEFAGKDLSYLVNNKQSTIEMYSKDGSDWLIINFEHFKTIDKGIILPNDIPDKKVERTATTYQSWLLHRNYTYTTYFLNSNTQSDVKLMEAAIIISERVDGTYIDCSFLKGSVTEKYFGILIN